ncbi:MAG: TonB-dependent siderophore receptor [Rhizobacter sp.]|nr:TonB-dependent siderophore receptor [Rhizobacter sp.]
MNHRTQIASALLAVFATPGVWAQQQPPAAPAGGPDAVMPAVKVQSDRERGSFAAPTTSITKLPADLHDVPQSVTVLNKALLQTQGATSLADALRNVPGITLGGAEGGQIGNNINLNGFSARTDIYLDGFRDRGQYYRDTFALDAVEVLMGPSSMLFGRGSTGGVINQVTKKPSLTPSTEVTGSVTTNGMVRATADKNTPISETEAFRISLMAQDGRPTTRDEMKNRDFGLAPSVKLGIGTPTQITLSALLQHNHDMPDYGVSPLNGRPVAVDRNAFYGYTDDRLVQDVAAFSANLDQKLTPTMKLRNQLQYNDVRVNAVETASQTLGTVGTNGFTALTPAATSSLPLGSLFTRLQSHDRVIHDKSISDQLELSDTLEAGGMKHALLAGVELGHDSYYNQAYYRNGTCNGVALNPATGTSGYAGCESLIDPSYTSSPANAVSRTGNLAQSTANTVAAYVTDTAELSKQFKIVGGLRHDRYQASVGNSINSANTTGNTTVASQDQTVNFTAVRAGAIWQPTDAQSYYLSYSTSFNPSLEQLTITTGTNSQPLPPEDNKSYELGGKWDLMGGNVSLDSAVFQTTKSNARSQNSDGTYAAVGTVRVRGARLGASGELAHDWKVFAGYSYLHSEIVEAIAVGTLGNQLANTPKNSATLWTTYGFAPHWEVGGGAVFQSSRYANNTNLVQVSSYTRWDGTLAYRQKDWDIRLNLFNLANKYYYDALITSDGGRAVPGTGRSAMLTFAYHI